MTRDAVSSGLELAALKLGSSLPKGLMVEAASGASVSELLPEEVAATENWAPHRRTEFALGRDCARVALRKLGHANAPILFDGDGAPKWPAGIVGSISHKRQNGIAVVGSSSLFAGVGVDLELDSADTAEADVMNRVCPSRDERKSAEAARGRVRSLAALCLSAKEAFFKLQFPITGAWLDWEDIEISLATNTFRAGRTGLPLTHTGLFVAENGWIISAIWIKY
jgi:4'-phosphopantetheinyl transferase EntD